MLDFLKKLALGILVAIVDMAVIYALASIKSIEFDDADKLITGCICGILGVLTINTSTTKAGGEA
ncbi:MAG: hypothetical protein FWC26_00130 [Fibromonadales bacterium]|nr:hypothetical protein [Fibromonadales bacterium]